LSAVLVKNQKKTGGLQTVALSSAARYLALPHSWGLTTKDGSVGGAHAGYQVYPCLDGRAAVAALEPHFAARLCVAAGIQSAGRATMMLPATRLSLKRWFSKQTRHALDELAASQDLPIYTLA